ncbi:hypothetical protein LQG66_04745 [Bradyrhizobium ontarionense]|uniref:Proteasome subunit beta n=1 Tax=Bradyrhizobium ontarionense TaxID=2898149 RepID=A0ABY3RFY1_9BRAD|nr:hypothetical protein [Bradyrhizobium sp. A19]UFZ05628.1 hypothetical protein LQG66_04745 [Bradyrhizobium sp. A19]
MTVVVTAKVNDGIVLAADSAASFFDAEGHPIKIYNNANKIFNLVKVWPIGALVYGSGGIGSASVETLTKDLRKKLSDQADSEYWLNREAYTVEEVATKARMFLYETCYKQAYPEPLANFVMGYRVCGYSAQSSSSEIWEFMILGGECGPPYKVQGELDYGLRWAGENEALDRLVLGTTGKLRDFFIQHGIANAQAAEALHLELINQVGLGWIIPAMPIQDAIDVARFAVETSAKFARYGLRAETIGGPTEVAAITKHEGFKWVSRKHYYHADLNRETNHGQ